MSRRYAEKDLVGWAVVHTAEDGTISVELPEQAPTYKREKTVQDMVDHYRKVCGYKGIVHKARVKLVVLDEAEDLDPWSAEWVQRALAGE